MTRAIVGRAETSGDKQVVLEKIYDLWCKQPTQRLGQLIVAALQPKNAMGSGPLQDLDYVEDDLLVAAIEVSGRQYVAYVASACKHGFQAACLDPKTLLPKIGEWHAASGGVVPEICGYCAAFAAPVEMLRRFRVRRWKRTGRESMVHGEGVVFPDRQFAMRFPGSSTTLTGTIDDPCWRRWWFGSDEYKLEWLDP